MRQSPRSRCSATTTPPSPAEWTTRSITTPPATRSTGRRTCITDENLGWLRSLPYTYRIGDVGFCHGSPIEPRAYEYIFALEQARELMPYAVDLPEVTFIGHSHLCKAFAIGNGEVNDVVAQKFGIRKGYKYIISVGIGRPAARLRQPRVLRDLRHRRADGRVPARRVRHRGVGAAIFDADLALNFGKRLFLGV